MAGCLPKMHLPLLSLSAAVELCLSSKDFFTQVWLCGTSYHPTSGSQKPPMGPPPHSLPFCLCLDITDQGHTLTVKFALPFQGYIPFLTTESLNDCAVQSPIPPANCPLREKERSPAMSGFTCYSSGHYVDSHTLWGPL